MDIKVENKSKQISGVANYWLVWFVFIFILIYTYKTKLPLFLLIPAVVCVPIGNPIQMIIDANKNKQREVSEQWRE